jgi:hypothetical protein
MRRMSTGSEVPEIAGRTKADFSASASIGFCRTGT